MSEIKQNNDKPGILKFWPQIIALVVLSGTLYVALFRLDDITERLNKKIKIQVEEILRREKIEKQIKSIECDLKLSNQKNYYEFELMKKEQEIEHLKIKIKLLTKD